MNPKLVPPLHPQCRMRVDYVGNEQQPVMVIENFLAEAEFLIDVAESHCQFASSTYFYPGIQAVAPMLYEAALVVHLKDIICDVFKIKAENITHSKSEFAMVLTPPAQLQPTQSRPHVDSDAKSQLAGIHYLCGADKGGTSLYRHKATGFESVDIIRRPEYDKYLALEVQDVEWQGKYINETNQYYERIASYDSVFNSVIFYHGNNLHSANIAPDFNFDPNPRTGRLTLTSFIHSRE